MTASLDTLVIAAYVFASTLRIARSGPQGSVTDHELIALAVCQAIVGIPSDRQFLGIVGRLLPGFFPVLPTQSRYNRRLRRLAPYLTTVQLQIAELIASGLIRLVDDPEHAARGGVGLLGHDLLDEPAERLDPVFSSQRPKIRAWWTSQAAR